MEGLTQTALPWILSRPPSRKVRGREASGVLVYVVTSRWRRVDP